MKILKSIKGKDNIMRTWCFDTDTNMVIYQGLAKDFNQGFKINSSNINITADEILEQINLEIEGGLI